MNLSKNAMAGLIACLIWSNSNAENLVYPKSVNENNQKKWSQLSTNQTSDVSELFDRGGDEERKNTKADAKNLFKTGGSARFTNLRVDYTVPEKCRRTRIEQFTAPDLMIFTVSTIGAVESGFTYEYPLKRSDGSLLYNVFHFGNHDDPAFKKKLKNDPQLRRDYQVLLNNHVERGFEFDVEGEVLELLVLVALEQNLREQNNSGLFVTGSVQYTNLTSSGAIGELDVVIGDKMTCEIIGYGEVKLGRGAIGKARSQIQRFYDFLGSTGYHPDWVTPGAELSPVPHANIFKFKKVSGF